LTTHPLDSVDGVCEDCVRQRNRLERLPIERQMDSVARRRDQSEILSQELEDLRLTEGHLEGCRDFGEIGATRLPPPYKPGTTGSRLFTLDDDAPGLGAGWRVRRDNHVELDALSSWPGIEPQGDVGERRLLTSELKR